MGNNRNITNNDQGDMLIENMVSITIVAAALLFALTTFNIMSISSATASKNQAIVSGLNNELETRLATGNYPAPGASSDLAINGTTGSIWTESIGAGQAMPVTRITLSIPVADADPDECTAQNTSPDCFTISGTTVHDLGANVKILEAATNQGADQYTVKIPAGTKSIHYAIKFKGSQSVSSLYATSYKESAKIATAYKSGGTGWNNGKIMLDPSKGTTTVGFRNAKTTDKLDQTNIIVLGRGG